MKEDETMDEMFERLSNIINDLDVIIEGNDLDKITYDELRGKLLAYESASNKKQDNNKKSMAFKTKVSKSKVEASDKDSDEEMVLFAKRPRKIVTFREKGKCLSSNFKKDLSKIICHHYLENDINSDDELEQEAHVCFMVSKDGVYKRTYGVAHNAQTNTKLLSSLNISFQKKGMLNPNLIVATLYPDGELKRDVDGIGFSCPNPILFYIQRIDMLDELKHIILCTIGRLLEGDVHVRVMFDLHHRYGPRQVMELLAETRNVAHFEGGQSISRPGSVGAIAAPPLRIAILEVSMKLDSDSDDGSDR
ncbi:hypothetical protein PIB30_057629 [Stylosanthes scabra]|uniref:Uncharacterized protein n=1 Tax=Stylosanthes scabra TaxID=79078 RepID=A0ABU6TKA9_9FABA|nr:hypothetical protein [Stylosanthes scabra]